MTEQKRQRGRPATGRREYKQLTLRLKPEQYDYIDYISKKQKKSKADVIISGLKLLEQK